MRNPALGRVASWSIVLWTVALASCAVDGTGVAEDEELALLELRHHGQLREDLEAIRVAGDVVGLSAAVSSSDGKAERARVGRSEIARNRPIPDNAQFRIASVTKSFTAVVTLQLVQESKLSLSDSVEKWLPGVVRGHGNDGAKISILQLLRHESGLANYVESPELGALVGSVDAFEEHRFDAISAGEYVAYALQREPDFVPGERFLYSNTNYVLLGMVIEAVTGRSFREEVEHRIVAKLGLRDTYVPGHGPFLVGPHLHGYSRFSDSDELVDVTDTSLISAADAGVVSSLTDLNRFFRALLEGELLSPALLAAMQTTVPVDSPDFPGARYGLGLQWSPLGCGGGYWHHTGDTLGYWVRTGVTSDGSRSVALVGNSPIDDELAHEAAAALIEHALCAR
jgi:D-alanyl-D-alanine carboxypeptidase